MEPAAVLADERVAEPFRTDPRFWSSVCASADAVVLLVLAALAAALLRAGGAPAGLALLPFVLPVAFVTVAGARAAQFRRAHQPRAATLETSRGTLSWRDAERTAVAAVFGRAIRRPRGPLAR